MKGVLQRARQSLGNTVDRVGTALNLPERNLSEWWSGNQTTFTGTTPQSQNAGFIRNTGGDKALNTRSTNPETMRQVQQQMSRNIQGQPPAPVGTPSLSEWNRRQQQTQQNAGRNTGGLGMGGSGGSGTSNVDAEEARQQAEEARLRAEQEAKNEQFRQRLGSEYGNIRNKFGNIIGTFEGKMRDLPNTIRQLSEQYKSTIGEKQGQELGQIEQKRGQVQAQQKAGLASIAKDAARNIRSGARRLGALGMASSAAGMFQRAIQGAANESAQNLLIQAANNYQGLDNEVNKVKSAYSTMLKEIDAEDNARIQEIQRGIPERIAKINERLQRSGEYERIDKEDLNNTYISELQAAFEEAERETKSLRDQAEQWRRDNEGRIGQLKNRIVQDFIPKEITSRELLKPKQETKAPAEEGLGLNRLRATPEDEEEIATPSNLQEIVRRRRQNNNL
jgi:hypothetical protein